MKTKKQITLTLEPGKKVDRKLMKLLKEFDPNPKLGTCELSSNRETIILHVEPEQESGVVDLFHKKRKLISIAFKNIFIEMC